MVLSKKSKGFLVSAGEQGFVKLWDFVKNTCKTLKTHAKELNFIRVSKNEKLIATGSHDRTVNLYSRADFKVVATINAHNRGVWDCDFDPAGHLLASCSSDNLIKIWNIDSLQKIELENTLEGSTSAVLRVKFILYGL